MDKTKPPNNPEAQEAAPSPGNGRDDNLEHLDDARKERQRQEQGEKGETEIPVVDKRFWTQEGARLEKGKKRKAHPTFVEELKGQGKKIVATNGSFDLLHATHVYFLQETKKQGDILIVGLNSDASVRSYKSPDRPIINEHDRAEMGLMQG